MMYKILWLSNVRLLTNTVNSSGTWIHTMYNCIKDRKEIDICANITISNVKSIVKTKNNNFVEYLLPSGWIWLSHYNKKFERAVEEIIREESPDLLHIWGTELPWARVLYSKQILIPCLLEIQGFKGLISKPIYFNAGLKRLPQNCLRYLEDLLPQYSLNSIRKTFEKWDRFDHDILSQARYINTQSQWVRDVIHFYYRSDARVFCTNIALREKFVESSVWRKPNNVQPIVFSVSTPYPYKGLHIALKAIYMLKKDFPGIRLRVAGISVTKRSRLSSGYIRYILKLIRQLDLKNNVEFIGYLNDEQMVKEMHNADVFVNPTFVETYCVALAEAMAIGIPTVSSYTAAIPELVEEKMGLLFPMGDTVSCAANISKLLNSLELSNELAFNSSNYIRNKIDKSKISINQVAIYCEILKRI